MYVGGTGSGFLNKIGSAILGGILCVIWEGGEKVGELNFGDRMNEEGLRVSGEVGIR
jgi:hypothetical protein